MKYLGEKTTPDPRTGVPGPFDLFEFSAAGAQAASAPSSSDLNN